MGLHKQGEPLPAKGLALTAPIEMPEQDTRGAVNKRIHRGGVKGHPKILDVPPQLGAERRPDPR